MARKVVIEAPDAAQSVRLMGRVFSVRDMDSPIRDPVAVRRTLPATLFLEPGKYVYVFDVQSGSGSFSVTATASGTGTMTCDTADGTVGHKLRFKVLG